jgi:hypothetical protein
MYRSADSFGELTSLVKLAAGLPADGTMIRPVGDICGLACRLLGRERTILQQVLGEIVRREIVLPSSVKLSKSSSSPAFLVRWPGISNPDDAD